MIDSLKDDLMTLVEATKVCPRIRGKKVHCLSVWRWATEGLRGVKLEHVRVGRNMCTTEAALNAFFLAVALHASWLPCPKIFPHFSPLFSRVRPGHSLPTPNHPS